MNKPTEPNMLHTTFHSSADEEEFTINTYQDAEPILEAVSYTHLTLPTIYSV